MNETEVRSKEQKIEEQLSNAVTILKEEQKSCVILSEDGAVRCSDAIGIKPLMVELRADRKAFQGSVIADKVVGKAAALLAVLGEVQAVFGRVMSEGAVSIFEKHQIPYQFETLVPYIENRTKDGMCPMEETVQLVEDPGEAFEALEKTIARLMKK